MDEALVLVGFDPSNLSDSARNSAQRCWHNRCLAYWRTRDATSAGAMRKRSSPKQRGLRERDALPRAVAIREARHIARLYGSKQRRANQLELAKLRARIAEVEGRNAHMDEEIARVDVAADDALAECDEDGDDKDSD